MHSRIHIADAHDINYGVDFELAREALHELAGDAFRAYWKLLNDAGADPASVEAAEALYHVQDTVARTLRAHDEQRIAAVLRDPRRYMQAAMEDHI